MSRQIQLQNVPTYQKEQFRNHFPVLTLQCGQALNHLAHLVSDERLRDRLRHALVRTGIHIARILRVLLDDKRRAELEEQDRSGWVPQFLSRESRGHDGGSD